MANLKNRLRFLSQIANYDRQGRFSSSDRYIVAAVTARGSLSYFRAYGSLDDLWYVHESDLRELYNRTVDDSNSPVLAPSILVSNLLPATTPIPFAPWTTTYVIEREALRLPQFQVGGERHCAVTSVQPPILMETPSLADPVLPHHANSCCYDWSAGSPDELYFHHGSHRFCARSAASMVRCFSCGGDGTLQYQHFGFCSEHTWGNGVFRPYELLRRLFGKFDMPMSQEPRPGLSSIPLVGTVYPSLSHHVSLVVYVEDFDSIGQERHVRPDSWLARCLELRAKKIPIYRFYIADERVDHSSVRALEPYVKIPVRSGPYAFEAVGSNMVPSSRRLFSSYLEVVQAMEIEAYTTLVPGGAWWGSLGSFEESAPVAFGDSQQRVADQTEEIMTKIRSDLPEVVNAFVPPDSDFEDDYSGLLVIYHPKGS